MIYGSFSFTTPARGPQYVLMAWYLNAFTFTLVRSGSLYGKNLVC
jgi:hypothetical protein